MLLPSESVEGDVNIDVEVKTKNRFKIDLLDYIPLAERRRLAVSGSPVIWSANLAATLLAIPRLLKEIFLTEYGLTVKSVNSHPPKKHTFNCDARDSKIYQHPYSIMLQDGRVIEVMVNTSNYSNSVQANSADFDEDKVSPKYSSLQSANLNHHTASVPNFTIKVKFEQCSNVTRMESDTSESVMNELDSISLQKGSILSLPDSQFDRSKLPHSRKIPTEVMNCSSLLIDSYHLTTDENVMEANLTPSYSQKPRQVINHSQGFSVSDTDKQEYNFDNQIDKCNMSLSTSGSYGLQENEIHNSISKIHQPIESAIPHHRKRIKLEPVQENDNDQNSKENDIFVSLGKHSNGCSSSVLPLKVLKMEMLEDIFVNELDRIPLRKRMEMLLSKRAFEFKSSKQSQSFVNLENHYVKVKQHKRKKTATDSVETALKEDAPGILQVLIDSGVDFKDIKLYETMNDDDSLCELYTDSSEDCFDDFGNVIAKLFSKCPSMFFKMGSFQDNKGSEACYSLTCLVSLIEQIRYMQLNKCPVQWGWCRDIQSFIFIFEKHNRIVVERPEYGYATYFFELVEPFPIDWQVKRLVTTMKLTNYSRIALIENKPLIIGEHLSEGEARVLEDYGWTPNSGLGSLLNFVDRVFHDRKSEMNRSEWKSKIGKLLMKGYYGGKLLMSNLPKKVSEYMSNSHTVKCEANE